MISDKKICLSILLGLLFLIQTGCKEKSPESKFIEERHDQIMVIHDEVMPKMSDIYKLKKKFKKDPTLQKSHLIDSLEHAEEVMMEWMHNYKKPSSRDTLYEDYLNEQMEAVSEMRDVMLRIIDKSQKTIDL